MTLAIFDLDNTLIGGDSDHLWGEFVVEQGLVDASTYAAENDRFYQDYQRGELDITAYLRFALAPLATLSMEACQRLHQRFMAAKILPIVLPKAQGLVESHRAKGHTLLVITATNRFVTEPIVQHFGIQQMLASEPEVIDGQYTGRPVGTPCYQDGKVTRLNDWLTQQPHTLEGSYFYSDSINDVPLLEVVTHPVAVDPDEKLRAYALERGFPVISLR